MHLKQLVRAPRYRVFRAWTDPAEIVQWWAPPGSTHTRVEMDLTLNGAVSYRAVTEGRYFQAEGKFTEVEGPLRLAMSWRFRTILTDRWEGSKPPSEKETRLTVQFHDRGTSTEIELSHTDFTDPAAAAEIEKGWTGALTRLAASVGE